MRVLRVLVVVVVAVVALAGCKRPCVTADQCKRTADCTDSKTNDTEKCTVGFLCEEPEGGGEKSCEDDYQGFTDDDMCAKFAAKGVCGTNRCSSDSQCERTMSCDCLDGSQQPSGQKFDCTVKFVCDPGDRICGKDFTRTEADLCLTNCRTNVQLPAGCQ